jgi:hypothetical protein
MTLFSESEFHHYKHTMDIKHHEFIFSQIFTRRMQTCDHSLGLNSVYNRHIVRVHDASALDPKEM